MPPAFLRGLVLQRQLLEERRELQDQLQLLLWGGLAVAVLGAEAPDAGPAPAYPAGVDVLIPGHDAPVDPAQAPAPAAAVVRAWASRKGLAWPGEAAVACVGSGGAAAVRRQLGLPADGGDVASAPAPVPEWGPEDTSDGLLVFPAGSEWSWRRLRLALGHANLRRSHAHAAPAGGAGEGEGHAAGQGGGQGGGGLVVVGTAMKASREADLCREGLLNLVPREGVCFVPLDLSAPLAGQLPFHALLHKASDELVAGPGASRGAAAEGHGGSGSSGGGGGSCPAFSERVAAMAAFAAERPRISVIDPLEATAKVISRTELAAVCESLAQLRMPQAHDQQSGAAAAAASGPSASPAAEPSGPSVRFRAPRSTLVTSFEEAEVAAAMQRLGCPPPYIVKPVVACGTPDSHAMALALWPEALRSLGGGALPLPAVVQEFVNHDAAIYKVYVAGTAVFHTVRPSIPNVPLDRAEAARVASSGVLLFDSLKSLPTALPTAPPAPPSSESAAGGGGGPAASVAGAGEGGPAGAAPAAVAPPRAPPSKAVFEAVAGHLRSALGLSLFGFDVVVASGSGSGGSAARVGAGPQDAEAAGPAAHEQQEGAMDVVVVDVNYFPSYRGAPNAPELFRAAVLGAHAAQQQQRRGRRGGVL